ncbi:MAG: alcohol dehydrogenase, iron-containing, partial [Deltaproteobacteria bacterium]|nr:alcohol dehydrogenase, iron-containing [Deltaproteobacteria bacterium]
MAYWFENPTLKALAPLALSTSIKGLTTIFNTPKMFMGSNVFPEGPVVGPSTMDSINPRCPRKRAFIVTDEFSKRFAIKAVRFLESGGFTVQMWAGCQPEAPIEVVMECAQA